MKSKCPKCGSGKVVSGRYLSQTDSLGTLQVFRPKGLKRFSMVGTDVSISNTFDACLDCGLLWGKIAKEKLLKIISRKGNKTLKQGLGIT